MLTVLLFQEIRLPIQTLSPCENIRPYSHACTVSYNVNWADIHMTNNCKRYQHIFVLSLCEKRYSVPLCMIKLTESRTRSDENFKMQLCSDNLIFKKTFTGCKA
jgi:hypothetical protein